MTIEKMNLLSFPALTKETWDVFRRDLRENPDMLDVEELERIHNEDPVMLNAIRSIARTIKPMIHDEDPNNDLAVITTLITIKLLERQIEADALEAQFES